MFLLWFDLNVCDGEQAADKSRADPCLQSVTRTNWDKDGGQELSLTLG